MWLIGVGLGFMLAGLAALLAMVVQLVTPGLGAALAAFAALFGGMLLTLVSAAGRLRESDRFEG